MTISPDLPFNTAGLNKDERKLLSRSLARAGEMAAKAGDCLIEAGTCQASAVKHAERGLNILAELDQLDDAARARFGGSILNDQIREIVNQSRHAAGRFVSFTNTVNEKSTKT